MDEIIHHLAVFISDCGRYMSLEKKTLEPQLLSLIKYLHTLGFDVTNGTFAENA